MVLAVMASKGKDMEYYLKTVFNKNDAIYDKGLKSIKGVANIIKGGKANVSKGVGQIGQAVGGNFVAR